MRFQKAKATVQSLLALGALVVTLPASAGAILSPTSVVSNTAGDFGAGFTIVNTINGSGLPAFTSGVTDFGTYLGGNPLHSFNPGTEWFSPNNGVRTSTIVYDLGASYTITRMALWNEDAGGLTDVSVAACSDAACTTAAPLLGATALTDNPNSQNYPADVLDITDATTRYVRLIVNGPQDASAWDGLAMGEVAFDTAAAAVPEPGSLALFGLGFVIAGVARSRLRR